MNTKAASHQDIMNRIRAATGGKGLHPSMAGKPEGKPEGSGSRPVGEQGGVIIGKVSERQDASVAWRETGILEVNGQAHDQEPTAGLGLAFLASVSGA
jgi:hypothetical protein